MSDYKELVEKTIEVAKETSDLLHQDQQKEGNEKFNELVEFLIKINAKLTEQSKAGQELAIDPVEFFNIISNLFDALQNKDMVLIADIIEYELLEKLEVIKSEAA